MTAVAPAAAPAIGASTLVSPAARTIGFTGNVTIDGSPAASEIGSDVSSGLDNENVSVPEPPSGTPVRAGDTRRPTTTVKVRSSRAISTPLPLRPLATIVSVGVVAAGPTANV